MWLVGLRDLQWRRWRFLITTVAAAAIFGLALMLAGVSASFHNEAVRTVSYFGVDSWVVRAGTVGPFTGAAPMPADQVAAVASASGVSRADPVVILRATTHQPSLRDLNLVGVVPGGIGSPPDQAQVQALQRGGAALTDASLGYQTGDHVEINGRTFKIVGLLHNMTYFAGIPVVIISIQDAQALAFGSRQLVTGVAVKGTPAEVPAGLTVMSNADVESDIGRPLNKATQTISLITWILWAVAAGIVGAIIYVTALERTRDFAVLKATGASTGFVLGGLLMEAVVVSLVAAVLGSVLELAIAPASSMPVEVPASAFVLLPFEALMVGIVASLAAVWRAARVDPSAAFAGP